MPTADEIRENLENYSEGDLANLLNDERETVKEMAQKELDSRRSGPDAGPQVEEFSKYDPRQDPGPTRYEDQIAPRVDTPLSSEEVPLEESRRDETTVLATDIFNSEGNRVERQ